MSNSGKLSFKEKFGYGLGDTACNLYFQMFINFLLFFYTDVFGIPAAVAGTLLVVSRFWDAVNDPLMGIIADRTETKWGKFRPYLIWMSIPLAIVGVLMFSTPEFSMTGKIVYAYVTYMLMMITYTAVNIPYSALLGVLSPLSRERTSASTYRFVLAFAGGLIIQASTLPLVHSLGYESKGYQLNNNIISFEEIDTRTSKIIVTADDGEHQTEQEFLIEIKRNGELSPVVENPLQDVMLKKGFGTNKIDISNVFTNPNGGSLTYDIKNNNSDVIETELESGTISLKEKSVGTAQLTLTAFNEHHGQKNHKFNVNVIEKDNHVPQVVSNIPDTTFNLTEEEQSLPITHYFSDPDGDELRYGALSKNSGIVSAEVVEDQLKLSVRETGIADIVVMADDHRGGIVKDTFQVQIKSDQNDPPAVLASLASVELNEGFKNHKVDISNAFHDLDGDKLSYSIKKVDVAKGFRFTLIIYGVLATILLFFTFSSTEERVKAEEDQSTSLKKDLKDLSHNIPWITVLIMGMLTLGYTTIRIGTIMYYFKYFVQNTALASLFMVTGTIATIGGVACTDFLSEKLGKKKLYLIVMVITSILSILFYYIPKENVTLILAVNLITMFFMAPQAPIIWAMYADMADYSEWKNNRRSTGLIFSASTFSQKFGMALGGGLIGWLLSLFNFQPNVAQAQETLVGIRLMMSYIPAATTILAGIVASFYKLDDQTMEKIEADLARRKS